MRNIFGKIRKSLTSKVGVVSNWVILLTFSAGLFSSFFDLTSLAELGIFIVLMITLGIPHGATDHIVFFSQKNRENKLTSWKYFLLFYLGTMLAYACAWYFLPLFCFIVFLAFSAYHFGQSQLYYLTIESKKWLKTLLYFFWGSTLLLSILGFNADETLSILSGTPFIEPMKYILARFEYILIANIAVLVALLVNLATRKKISFSKVLQELALLILLLFLCWSVSLLLTFAIYFALWHSLQTIEKEIKVFDDCFEKGYSLKEYGRDVLPFSLISFLGIGIILTGLYFFEFSTPNLLFVFFVLISILTAPHALLIESIYD
ncbi:Brp/Blh family beta-carotene 15,15'-dioxygenase [Bernardetia sp. ABR2-2B]|uniref:Brp/Blh family beta-carotene 15,15'-dioxygenase n=1 Tax=Bernardetia sp. ABR2-2B TaxID=3127472 RepID=UPI0030D04B16